MQTINLSKFTLRSYPLVGLRSSHLRKLDQNTLVWLVGKLYIVLASQYAVRAAETLGKANEIRTGFTFNSFQDSVATKWYGKPSNFSILAREMVTDNGDITAFIWRCFFEYVPMNKHLDIVFSTQSFASASASVARNAKWLGKTMLQFDYYMLYVGQYAMPLQSVDAQQSEVAGLVQLCALTQANFTFKSANQNEDLNSFYRNYFGVVQKSSVAYMSNRCKEILSNGNSGNFAKIAPDAAKYGPCDVCGFPNVLLQGHAQRCRVQEVQLNLDHGLDWLGDGLLAMDVRIAILHYYVPKERRGNLFMRFTANAELAVFLSSFGVDKSKRSDKNIGTMFESSYLSVYRAMYMKHVMRMLSFEYRRKPETDVDANVAEYAQLVQFYKVL